MSSAVSEVTFLGVSPRAPSKDGKPAPSAANMPGWKVLSAAIKDIVETSGIPVAVIAEKTNLTRQYVYSMMNGTCNPSMDKIEAVMEAAGTSFHTWMDENALYGKDRTLHTQIQLLLNRKGIDAIALRRTIEGLIALSSDAAK